MHFDFSCCRKTVWLVVAISTGLAVGCWQVVEHVESEPAPAPQAPMAGAEPDDSAADDADVATDADAFADDFAASLSDDPLFDDPGVAAALDPPADPAADEAPAGERHDSLDDLLFGPDPDREAEEPLVTPPAGPEETAGEWPEFGAFDDLAVIEPPRDDEEPMPDDSAALPPEAPAVAPDDRESEPPAVTAAEQKARRAAWLLGSKLSLAALAHGSGASGDDVHRLMEQSRALTRPLGVEVPNLPTRPLGAGNDRTVDRSLDYLSSEGQEISRALSRRHGAQGAALFEMAVKSNTLLVKYRPGASETEALSQAITQAASQAQLPDALWQPLVDLLARQAPRDEVRAAVYRLHADVDRYLAGAIER